MGTVESGLIEMAEVDSNDGELSYSRLVQQGIAVSLCIQVINWGMSYFLRIDNFTGFMNFNALFVASLLITHYINSNGINIAHISSKQLFVTFLGMLWNIRLSIYLIIRMVKRGCEDSRMNKMRLNPIHLAKFWVIHAFWCLIVSLPVTLVNTINLATDKSKCSLISQDINIVDSSFSWIELIAILVYFYGVLIESIADWQKFNHWQSKSVSFCDNGIWQYSRNPNFAGEIIIWFGMALLSSNTLSSAFAKHANCLIISNYTQYVFICLPYLAPIFTFTVLLFLSGVNLNEWKLQKIYGKTKEYRSYRQNTSAVWPCPSFIYQTFIPNFVKTTIMCEWKYYIRKDRQKRH